jgi:hypothetical protein
MVASVAKPRAQRHPSAVSSPATPKGRTPAIAVMRRVIHLNGVPQSLAGGGVLAYETSMQSAPAVLVAVAVFCAACGSSGRVRPSDGSGATVDGSGEAETGAPETDGAAPGDTGSLNDSDADRDGGAACSFAATGVCNSVALQGAWVMPTVSSAANPPSLTAGAIADGTYVLTAVTTYDATASEADGSTLSPGSPDRANLVVAGGCLQWNDSRMGSSWSFYPTNDGLLTFEQECSAGPTWWASYAASTTTLVLAPVSFGGLSPVYTFARQ